MAMMRLRREDPRVVGSFRLHRRLGAGGMGVVYLGSDRKGQRVALKVIRPDLAEDQEFRSRFAREVSAARRIRGDVLPGWSPRISTPIGRGSPRSTCPGRRFTTRSPTRVRSVRPRSPPSGPPCPRGLVAVHEAGVVHRDLKPSNILLSPKGPRIIDFGIAWATGASTLTHVGTAVGSPGFLAPEQVRGLPSRRPPMCSRSGPRSLTPRPPTRPSGTVVPRSCCTAWCTRRRSCTGCRTRSRRWSARASPRIPRSGPARFSCPCGSRRSRRVRRRGLLMYGRLRLGRPRRIGLPGGLPTVIRSSSGRRGRRPQHPQSAQGTPAPRGAAPSSRGGGSPSRGGGVPSRPGQPRATPAGRNTTRSGGGVGPGLVVGRGVLGRGRRGPGGGLRIRGCCGSGCSCSLW